MESGPGRMDGWLPAIISFVFHIVACSSPPFLFSPLPFVCLTLLLSIWPAIDKTQSLTMLGTLHRIGGDGARALWRACFCSGFWKEMGWGPRHCLSTSLLPDGAQQKECASSHTHTLFLDISLSSLLRSLHLSCGSPWCMGMVSGPELCNMR